MPFLPLYIDDSTCLCVYFCIFLSLSLMRFIDRFCCLLDTSCYIFSHSHRVAFVVWITWSVVDSKAQVVLCYFLLYCRPNFSSIVVLDSRVIVVILAHSCNLAFFIFGWYPPFLVLSCFLSLTRKFRCSCNKRDLLCDFFFPCSILSLLVWLKEALRNKLTQFYSC